MNHEQTLQELGLTRTEAAAYLALIQLGGSQASAVAKHLGIKRTTIYDVLSSLTKKGFAAVYFRQNKRIYHPQKPQRVADHFEKKLEAFTNIISDLASIEKQQAHAVGLRVIQSKAELQQFYLDIIEEYPGKSYDIIGSTTGWTGALGEAFVERFRRERAKAKIHTRLLLSFDTLPHTTAPDLLRDWRLLPKHYRFESTIDIFPEQVLIISPHFSALAVVIDSPIMVDIFHSIFEIIWSFADEGGASSAHLSFDAKRGRK